MHQQQVFNRKSKLYYRYLPENPWITKIVRLEIWKLEAVSLALLLSSMSVDLVEELLVNRWNFVAMTDGFCGSFAQIAQGGVFLKQPYLE